MRQFSCSNYEQKRSYKDLFSAGKNEPPGLHRPKINTGLTKLATNLSSTIGFLTISYLIDVHCMFKAKFLSKHKSLFQVILG